MRSKLQVQREGYAKLIGEMLCWNRKMTGGPAREAHGGRQHSSLKSIPRRVIAEDEWLKIIAECEQGTATSRVAQLAQNSSYHVDLNAESTLLQIDGLHSAMEKRWSRARSRSQPVHMQPPLEVPLCIEGVYFVFTTEDATPSTIAENFVSGGAKRAKPATPTPAKTRSKVRVKTVMPVKKGTKKETKKDAKQIEQIEEIEQIGAAEAQLKKDFTAMLVKVWNALFPSCKISASTPFKVGTCLILPVVEPDSQAMAVPTAGQSAKIWDGTRPGGRGVNPKGNRKAKVSGEAGADAQGDGAAFSSKVESKWQFWGMGVDVTLAAAALAAAEAAEGESYTVSALPPQLPTPSAAPRSPVLTPVGKMSTSNSKRETTAQGQPMKPAKVAKTMKTAKSTKRPAQRPVQRPMLSVPAKFKLEPEATACAALAVVAAPSTALCGPEAGWELPSSAGLSPRALW
jgi:hypothetical protein